MRPQVRFAVSAPIAGFAAARAAKVAGAEARFVIAAAAASVAAAVLVAVVVVVGAEAAD